MRKIVNNQQGFAHLLIIGLVGLFIGGAGTTVAANSSKPGDVLYSVDRASERVSLALALTDGIKESNHRSRAKERLTELQQLFAESEVDAEGVSDALNNFEDHKSKLASLVDDSSSDTAKEIDDEFEDHESKIDKLFEKSQSNLEDRREKLKKDYETAKAKGDTSEAARLLAEINGIEGLLKTLESERETSKQELEAKETEIESHQSEEVKKQEEQERETEKKAAEVDKKAAEEKAEAEKKAAEEQAEAEKKAAEDQN